LFNDFTTTLAAKEKAIHQLEIQIEGMEHSIGIIRDKLTTETALRVQSQTERDKALRNDASAAKVVERYMTFTQKTHKTVHMHLENLRARSTSTQATLRKEALGLRNQLTAETERGQRLRAAMDEMNEGLGREAAGRRREVTLRLKMLAIEERRERKVEVWLNKVRRAREGAEGAVLESDLLEGLVDEGVKAVSHESDRTDVSSEKQRSWRGILSKKVQKQIVSNGEEASLARVLLAEELVNTLVIDLQIETDRRIELEKQRVEWLAREAVDGVEPGEGDVDGDLMFDAENLEEGRSAPAVNAAKTLADEDGSFASKVDETTDGEAPPLPSPLPESAPLIDHLRNLFNPLTERHMPLQKTMHDLSLSLTSLRSSLPVPSPEPDSTSPKSKKSFPTISRKPIPPTSDPLLVSILDSIHEVIEDARVDVEIAVADEERVYRGFEALLGAGAGSGAVQGKEVMRDVREYVEEKRQSEGYVKLSKRVEDIEHDLALLKRSVHEVEGMEVDNGAGEENTGKRKHSVSVWQTLKLRTVTPTVTRVSASPVESSSPVDVDLDAHRRTSLLSSMGSSVGSVGRSFSATVIGTPKRVSGIAGGLYRGSKGSLGRREKSEESSLMREDDDVE